MLAKVFVKDGTPCSSTDQFKRCLQGQCVSADCNRTVGGTATLQECQATPVYFLLLELIPCVLLTSSLHRANGVTSVLSVTAQLTVTEGFANVSDFAQTRSLAAKEPQSNSNNAILPTAHVFSALTAKTRTLFLLYTCCADMLQDGTIRPAGRSVQQPRHKQRAVHRDSQLAN